jgi:hypothetical protein
MWRSFSLFMRSSAPVNNGVTCKDRARPAVAAPPMLAFATPTFSNVLPFYPSNPPPLYLAVLETQAPDRMWLLDVLEVGAHAPLYYRTRTAPSHPAPFVL